MGLTEGSSFQTGTGCQVPIVIVQTSVGASLTCSPGCDKMKKQCSVLRPCTLCRACCTRVMLWTCHSIQSLPHSTKFDYFELPSSFKPTNSLNPSVVGIAFTTDARQRRDLAGFTISENSTEQHRSTKTSPEPHPEPTAGFTNRTVGFTILKTGPDRTIGMPCAPCAL